MRLFCVMKSNNVDAVIFWPYPLWVCLLSLVIKVLAITKVLKKYKPQAFSVWGCISGGRLFTVSCGSSPQLFFSLFFSSFFFFSGLEKEAQEFWFPFCVRWNSLGKEAPLHLWLSVAADVTSFHHSLCVCMYVSCLYPIMQWGDLGV